MAIQTDHIEALLTHSQYDRMGTLTISPKKYGGLLARTLPKVIETDRELEHFAEVLESLDRLGRELRPEEKTLEALLDDRIELPPLPPHKTIAFLLFSRTSAD